MRSRHTRNAVIGLAMAGWLALGAAPALAEVFLSKSEALALAFPEADRLAQRSVALDDDEAERVQQLSQRPLESRLVTLHTAWKAGRVMGYALIDIHTVRTLPAAFMVVLTPRGEVRSVRALAFHEPPEYLPTNRWLRQFEETPPGEPARSLRVGGQIHGIAGSTLSARAVAGGVRRSLALYDVLVGSAEAPVAAHGTAPVPGGGR